MRHGSLVAKNSTVLGKFRLQFTKARGSLMLRLGLGSLASNPSFAFY